MGLVDRLDPLQSTLDFLLPEPEARRVPLRGVGIGAGLEIVIPIGTAFPQLMLKCHRAMTAGGDLTVRVANRCETGGNTLLVEISDIRSRVADAHPAVNARNHIGPPDRTLAIELPLPDRRPSKIHV